VSEVRTNTTYYWVAELAKPTKRISAEEKPINMGTKSEQNCCFEKIKLH
jgi:hypothetical protein